MWVNGRIIDVKEPGAASWAALAMFSCPEAFCIAGNEATTYIACDELRYCSHRLGHVMPPFGSLQRSVAEQSQRFPPGTHLAVAIVPTVLPETSLSVWTNTEVVVWTIDVPVDDSLLAAAIFTSALNELSQTINLRVTGDAEAGTARRWATREGTEIALWLNLRGSVARADRWSIVVEAQGVLVTPRLRDGAPFDAWRQRLVSSGHLHEREVSEGLLVGGCALITGWGTAYPIAIHDLSTDPEASLIVSQHLSTFLKAVSAERDS